MTQTSVAQRVEIDYSSEYTKWPSYNGEANINNVVSTVIVDYFEAYGVPNEHRDPEFKETIKSIKETLSRLSKESKFQQLFLDSNPQFAVKETCDKGRFAKGIQMQILWVIHNHNRFMSIFDDVYIACLSLRQKSSQVLAAA